MTNKVHFRFTPFQICCLAGPFLAVIISILLLGLPTLYRDEWDGFAAFLIEARTHGLSADLLWSSHNEHRLVLPRLLIYLYSHVSLSMVPIMLLSQGILAVAFILLLPGLNDAIKEWPSRLQALIYFLISALFFSFAQFENIFWGFQIAWSLEICGLILALTNLRDGRYRYYWLGFALAYLCSAHWVILIPITFYAQCLNMWERNQKPRVAQHTTGHREIALGRLSLWGLALLLLLLLYMRGQSAIAGATHSRLYALKHPIQAAIYLVCFLGNPFFMRLSSLSGYIAAGFGVLFLVTFVLLVWRQNIALGSASFRLLLAVLLLDALVCMGRLEIGIGQSLSSRYVACTCFAWVVLLTVVVRTFGRHFLVRMGVFLVLAMAFTASMTNLHYKIFTDEPQVVAGQACLRDYLDGKLTPEKESCLLYIYPSISSLKMRATELQRVIGWHP